MRGKWKDLLQKSGGDVGRGSSISNLWGMPWSVSPGYSYWHSPAPWDGEGRGSGHSGAGCCPPGVRRLVLPSCVAPVVVTRMKCRMCALTTAWRRTQQGFRSISAGLARVERQFLHTHLPWGAKQQIQKPPVTLRSVPSGLSSPVIMTSLLTTVRAQEGMMLTKSPDYWAVVGNSTFSHQKHRVWGLIPPLGALWDTLATVWTHLR